MMASKTKSRFETGFQQLKTGLPKSSVLTSLLFTHKGLFATFHSQSFGCYVYVLYQGSIQ